MGTGSSNEIGARDLGWRATLSIACIFTGCFPSLAPAAQSPIERFDFLTPRPFGYLIGDVIRHEIQLDLKKPYALQKGSIPTAGNERPPGDTADGLPERHLHVFFSSLETPYSPYEAENPQALERAIADLNALENLPLRYFE